ncbi:Tyrosine-protein kinase [Aphelenchoides besseyi]|nr:Tyrosine-protein kinase [Aphelenchoides besseyi]
MVDSNSKPSTESKQSTDKNASEKKEDVVEEEDVGYQRRIKIKTPSGVKEGDDPFVDPTNLLPIDDSFGQVIVPLNPDGFGAQDVVPPPTATRNEQLSPLPPSGITSSPKVETQPSTSPAATTSPAITPSQLSTPIQNQPSSTMGKGNSILQQEIGESGITAAEFYHGLLPREDITRMLAQNGDFLLRTTEISSGLSKNRQMCLSVKWNDVVQHFLLQPNANGLYALNDDPQQAFPTMLELTNFHLQSGIPFGPTQVVLEWEFRPDQVRLIRQVGSGAFGQVFHGFAIPRGAQSALEVAVKTLKCSMLNKEKIEEIMKEARIMRLLRHQNVVRCFGVSADAEPLMVLMEFVPGPSLETFLRVENVKIDIPERINMVLGERCEDCGIAVGDLDVNVSPQMFPSATANLQRPNFQAQPWVLSIDVAARNCLYGRKTVKLSDFGLSRQCTSYKMATEDLDLLVSKSYLQDSTEKAPLRWLAPEVFREQLCSFASDVWALGVVVWEIFTNASEPYAGWNGPKIKDEVLNRKYRLIAPDWAPSIIKDILVQCFIEDPAKRATCSSVVQMLLTAIQQNGQPPPVVVPISQQPKQPQSRPTTPPTQPAVLTSGQQGKFLVETGRPPLTLQQLFPQTKMTLIPAKKRPQQLTAVPQDPFIQQAPQQKVVQQQQSIHTKPVIMTSPVRMGKPKKKIGVSREVLLQSREVPVTRLHPSPSRQIPFTNPTINQNPHGTKESNVIASKPVKAPLKKMKKKSG